MLGSFDVMVFVPTKEPTRAREFYENVLGLHFVADEPFALVFDANGITLRIAKVAELTPSPATTLGWVVHDIASMVKELTGKGVVFQRYDGPPQDDLGIATFPGGAKVAWFKDPDGNLLSLSQPGG